jgi:hypothetical protein
LLGLGKAAAVVALFVGLVELGLGEVLLIDQVVEHFGQGWKTFLLLLNLTIEYPIDDLVDVVEHNLKRFTILLLENYFSLAITDLFLPVESMQVEAVGIGAFMSPQEMGTVFSSSK